MVPSHRRALRARLLSFRYMDGLCFRRVFSAPRMAVIKCKVMAGGTPANPATLVSAYARSM